jgi:hypothetical protein
LFAAPHGLSQRTTSFIASQRQGIHRIPLRHLIALIVDARHGFWIAPQPMEFGHRSERPANFMDTSVITTASMRLRPLRDDDCVTSSRFENNTRQTPKASSRIRLEQAEHLSQTRHLPRCKICHDGGARRDRTDDLLLAKQALSQLSYGPRGPKHQDDWWAWDDSNVRPHPYQGCALTT